MTGVCYNWTEWLIHSVSTHETVAVVTYTSMFTDRTSIIPCTYQHHLPCTLHYGYTHTNTIFPVPYTMDIHIPTPSSLYPTLWIYTYQQHPQCVSTHETVAVVTYTSMFTDGTSIIPRTYQHHLPCTLHYGYKHNNSIHSVCQPMKQ